MEPRLIGTFVLFPFFLMYVKQMRLGARHEERLLAYSPPTEKLMIESKLSIKIVKRKRD